VPIVDAGLACLENPYVLEERYQIRHVLSLPLRSTRENAGLTNSHACGKDFSHPENKYVLVTRDTVPANLRYRTRYPP